MGKLFFGCALGLVGCVAGAVIGAMLTQRGTPSPHNVSGLAGLLGGGLLGGLTGGIGGFVIGRRFDR